MTIALSITMAKLEGCLDLAFLFIIRDLNCLLVQESVTARSYAIDILKLNAQELGPVSCRLHNKTSNANCAKSKGTGIPPDAFLE